MVGGELEAIDQRSGCNVGEVYEDHDFGGAKGREKRPGFDRLCKDANLHKRARPVNRFSVA
jgi:DNA invertase Pin-like site-specific DNA recombinase